MIDLTTPVQAFRQAISCCWSEVVAIELHDVTGSFIDDWLQSTWERLVEAAIPPARRVVLEPYGRGADCNGSSSRVWQPDALPTHKVLVVSATKVPLIDLVNSSALNEPQFMDSLCSLQDGWPTVAEPFDCILLDTNTMATVKLSDVQLFAVPIID